MKNRFIGPDLKAWLANGKDELSQAFVPNVQQIQPGQLPTLLAPTQGEITAEKLDDKETDTKKGPDMDME